jgi:hypothetical protein
VNRTFLAASVALIIVAVAVGLALRPTSNVGTPISSAGPTVVRTPEPTAPANGVTDPLIGTWVGVPHDFPGASNVDFLTLDFLFGQLKLHTNFDKEFFTSPVAMRPGHVLELTGLSNRCDLEVVGHYTYSLSSGGTLLHLGLVDDPCAGRAAAVPGDWHRAGCMDETDVCWGDLEAGTYPTLFWAPRDSPTNDSGANYGGVTFTVPDGWAEGGDHTTDFRLLRSSDYAKETGSGPVGQQTEIEGWIHPSLVGNGRGGCDPATPHSVETTPDAAITWLQRRQAGISAKPAQSITIDGHAGRWIDISVAPDWTQACGLREATVALITEAAGNAGRDVANPWAVEISRPTRMRLIFVDISQPELRTTHTAMIVIAAPDQATFDGFVDEAMQVVSTFHFK